MSPNNRHLPYSERAVPASQTIAAPSSTFRGIQALRGIAALLVVACHATTIWAAAVYGVNSSKDWANGAIGVDIFFIISGFVMAISTIGREHKTHPARGFLERRLVRIVPLYWLMTALELVKVLLRPSAGQAPPTSGFVLTSFLFVPWKLGANVVYPLLAVGWTLQYEMFFYILFAVGLALRVNLLRWLAPVLTALAIAGFFIPATWPAFTSVANSPLLEFLGGLWLGTLILKRRSIPHWLAICAAICLGVFCFLHLSDPSREWRGLEWGPIAFLVVAGTIANEAKYGRLWPRWLLLIGDASYSLYLSHLLVFPTVMKVMHRFLVPGRTARMDEWLMVFVSLLICVPASFAVYFAIEKPINKLLRSHISGASRPSKHAVA